MAELILPDELALIGRSPFGRRYGCAAPMMAVAAGELAELAFRQRIALDAKRAHVIDPSPTGEPTLDEPLGALLRSGGPTKLRRWLSGRSSQYHWRLAHLCERGLMGYRKEKIMLLFDSHKYVPDPGLRQDVLTRLWHMLRGWRAVDPRTASLAGIVHGSRIGHELFPNKQDRTALRHFGRADVLGSAIGELLAANNAGAVAVASGGAAAGGGGGGGGC